MERGSGNRKRISMPQTAGAFEGTWAREAAANSLRRRQRQMTHDQRFKTEELISLQWQSAEESDRNLISLAEMMGLPARVVGLGGPEDAALREGSPLLESGSRVITSARALVELMGRPGGAVLLDDLLSKASHLFVCGFEPLKSHETLLAKLCGDTLASVRKVESKESRYQVSGTARDVCLQLSGLTFGPADPDNDVVFVAADGASNLRELITLGNRPYFVQTTRSSCNLMLMAGHRIANVDSPVSRGVSPLKWFAQLVPPIMFLRHAFGERCWHNDAPRGCLVIDDPLLKPTYGFLDYEDLLGTMKRRGFTTCIAFIPWNHARTSDRNAGFFKRNSDRYSICVHGCDHTKAEFGITDSIELDRRVSLAIGRMTLHEKRTGLPFDKVMVFPQGIFSSAALKALKPYDYVAVVNSTPYPVDRPDEICLRDFLDVAIMRYWNFPLFLRHYPVDLNACALDLFLGRPLLLVEHHKYFKNGCSALDEFVSRVQALDHRIIWTNLESACVNSFLKRVDPQGVIQMKIYTDRVSIANNDSERKHYRVWRRTRDEAAVIEATLNGKPVACQLEDGGVSVSLQLDPGDRADLRLWHTESRAFSENSSSGLIDASRTYLRRHLCELRDNYVSKSELLLKLIESGRKLLSKS